MANSLASGNACRAASEKSVVTTMRCSRSAVGPDLGVELGFTGVVNVGSPFEGRFNLLFEKSLSRGLQPADDDLRDAFHQFVAKVVIMLGADE